MQEWGVWRRERITMELLPHLNSLPYKNEEMGGGSGRGKGRRYGKGKRMNGRKRKDK